MKIAKFSFFIFLLFSASGLFCLTPDEIVKKADIIMYGTSFKADLILTSMKEDKVDSVIKMYCYLKGKNQMVIFYYYPPQQKNRAVLKEDDSLWIYIPTNKRFIKIGSKQSVQNSSFNYGDILNVRLADDYDASFLEENCTYNETECYKLELKAKTKDVTYASIIYYVRKADFVPVKREFYTSSGKLFKEMEFVSEKGRPAKFIMKSLLNKNEYSILESENVELNVDIPDSLFTKSYIKRRR